MEAAKKKIRQDLTLRRQEQRGTVYFVVKDPRTQRFFRFKEPEEFIIRHLDGEHSRKAIQKTFEERFDAELSAQAFAAFTARLGDLGLLEEPTQTGDLTARQNLLYLRFKAFDPNRVLEWLLPRTRLFFTRSFLWFSAALLFVAIILVLVNSKEIARETPLLLSTSSLLLIWLIVLAVGCTHEFAHGLTCKRYGGEVREMGFMLLFFLPAFYCNVSDAWLFPEKRQKLTVLIAGAYWQVVLWAVATVLWRVTAPATVPHHLALIVMTICGTHTLFNLNPLIKLDGYYLLSDYLEIPNLRKRAFGYVREQIKSLRGKATQGISEVTPRERQIYLVYGLLAGTYSFLLLGLIAFTLGGFLTKTYQALGFILFSVMLMILFKNPLKKMFRSSLAVFGFAPTIASSLRIPIKIMAVLLVLTVLFLGRMELKVTGEFSIFPNHNADVRAEVEGIIEEIYAGEGDVVHEGQLIARLSDLDFRAEIQKVEAEIVEKRARLRLLRAGPTSEELALAQKEVDTARTKVQHGRNRYEESRDLQQRRLAKARAAVSKAEERLRYARSYFNTHQELFDRNLISRLELEKSREELDFRAKELEEAQADLRIVSADDFTEVKERLAVEEKVLEEAEGKVRLIRAGNRPEEIEAVEAEISRLEAQWNYLREQLRLLSIVSPISGVVTTPKVKERIGLRVNMGDLVAEVYDLGTVVAEISIPEKEIADVRIGQDVVLRARAFFDKSFHGKVTAIAPAVTKTNGWQPERTIRVTTPIENGSLLLKPEMTGNAKIYTGRRRIIDIMTRRLARYFRVEFWSWW